MHCSGLAPRGEVWKILGSATSGGPPLPFWRICVGESAPAGTGPACPATATLAGARRRRQEGRRQREKENSQAGQQGRDADGLRSDRLARPLCRANRGPRRGDLHRTVRMSGDAVGHCKAPRRFVALHERRERLGGGDGLFELRVARRGRGAMHRFPSMPSVTAVRRPISGASQVVVNRPGLTPPARGSVFSRLPSGWVTVTDPTSSPRLRRVTRMVWPVASATRASSSSSGSFIIQWARTAQKFELRARRPRSRDSRAGCDRRP